MLILDSQNRPLRTLEAPRTETPRARGGRRRAAPQAPQDGRFLGRASNNGATRRAPQELEGRLARLARAAGKPAHEAEVRVRLAHLLPGADAASPEQIDHGSPREVGVPARIAERLRAAAGIALRVRQLVRPDGQGRVPLEHLRQAWACARLEERGASDAGRAVLRGAACEPVLAQLARDGVLSGELAQKVRAEVRGLFPDDGDWFDEEPDAPATLVDLQERLCVASVRVARG